MNSTIHNSSMEWDPLWQIERRSKRNCRPRIDDAVNSSSHVPKERKQREDSTIDISPTNVMPNTYDHVKYTPRKRNRKSRTKPYLIQCHEQEQDVLALKEEGPSVKGDGPSLKEKEPDVKAEEPSLKAEESEFREESDLEVSLSQEEFEKSVIPPVYCLKGLYMDEKEEYDDDEEKFFAEEDESMETEHCVSEVPIVLDWEKEGRLQVEYVFYLDYKWENLEALRQNLIENDWSELRGRHPNFQFIYESQETRMMTCHWLVWALKRYKENSSETRVFDRGSWINVDFEVGGPLFCSRETLQLPRKQRVMKKTTVENIITAIGAIIPLVYYNQYQTQRLVGL